MLRAWAGLKTQSPHAFIQQGLSTVGHFFGADDTAVNKAGKIPALEVLTYHWVKYINPK